MPAKEDPKILFDILNAAIIAAGYIEGIDETAFSEQPIVQDAIAMRLSSMGENTLKLSDEIKAQLAAIPFRKIRGMRNVIAHSYEDVNIEILWDVAKNHLPSVIQILTEHLARTTNFEEIIGKLYANPTLELLAQIHRPTSTLSRIIARGVELKFPSAAELADTIQTINTAKKDPEPPSGAGSSTRGER